MQFKLQFKWFCTHGYFHWSTNVDIRRVFDGEAARTPLHNSKHDTTGVGIVFTAFIFTKTQSKFGFDVGAGVTETGAGAIKGVGVGVGVGVRNAVISRMESVAATY